MPKDTVDTFCATEGCMLHPNSGACFEPNKKHRFALWRFWDVTPPLGFVMMNPSIADQVKDDRTITRCIGFAKREGYGGIIVCNLRSDVATNPLDLPSHSPVADAENYRHLKRLFDRCPMVIAGWGTNAVRFGDVMPLSLRKQPLYRLGEVNKKDGSPRHPLYLKGTTPILPWEPKYA